MRVIEWASVKGEARRGTLKWWSGFAREKNEIETCAKRLDLMRSLWCVRDLSTNSEVTKTCNIEKESSRSSRILRRKKNIIYIKKAQKLSTDRIVDFTDSHWLVWKRFRSCYRSSRRRRLEMFLRRTKLQKRKKQKNTSILCKSKCQTKGQKYTLQKHFESKTSWSYSSIFHLSNPVGFLPVDIRLQLINIKYSYIKIWG